MARDLNHETIPTNLTVGGASVEPGEVAGAFAKYFSNKIRMNVLRARVNVGGVYNGKCKLIVQIRNFIFTTWG